MTLLDACYLHAGIRGQPPELHQQRFADSSADEWAERVRALRLGGDARTGVAVHSVRAVDRDSMQTVVEVATELGCELHVHLSEQRSENEECMDVHGMSPAELVADAGVLGPRTTAVHATHVTPMDVELLAQSRTTVCMCPTTERDLGDGVGPTSAFIAAGVPLTFGSDSHAVIDLFEEARGAELHERLVARARGLTPPLSLFDAAVDGDSIEPGRPADLVTLDLSSPRLAGGDDDDLISRVVFSASAADVTDVVIGGRRVVSDRTHAEIPDVGRALDDAIGGLAWE